METSGPRDVAALTAGTPAVDVVVDGPGGRGISGLKVGIRDQHVGMRVLGEQQWHGRTNICPGEQFSLIQLNPANSANSANSAKFRQINLDSAKYIII